nr:hypothetical protein pmam_110 [Pithovirus mammoth]
MYQLRLAMESGDKAEFAEVCEVVSETTAVKFLTSLFLQKTEISPEQFDLLMEKVQSRNTNISGLQVATLTWALKADSPLLESLISHPNFNPLPEISRYASDCPLSFFSTLLASDKISVDRDTLGHLLSVNHPGKLEIYLNSDCFVQPSADTIAGLAVKYQNHHYSMEVVLKHSLIDASKIDKKQVCYWRENCPDIYEVLRNKPQLAN